MSTRLKIASASLNQTVYDFALNVPNILKAIDKAVADGADILALEELSLTGYAADDYHQWNKNNDVVWPMIEIIANYAAEKDPNLILSLGTPWHYADKTQRADDPAYNLNNRPYNTQMTIQGGSVVAISAKSILADGPAEYEPRQFNDWPLSEGTIAITLPDGTVVPFGKPVVMFADDEGNGFTLAHEICAEGWPGVHDDLTIDEREQREARNLIEMTKTQDISVVLNPSASKPEPAINKEKIRMEGLCKTGSRYCGVFVYTNFLGSNSGTLAAEGSRIFAQDGRIIHHGARYSFQDISYSSAVVDLPALNRTAPDVALDRDFARHGALDRTGGEAVFDRAYAHGEIGADVLRHEEYMRSIALWLRDYIAKPGRRTQGYLISLSGGKDSAYGAVAVTTMLDLDVQENEIEDFFRRFKNLKYKDEVLDIYREHGEKAALRALKDRFLTCIYLPTDNSSQQTQDAARMLIEGGTLPDGTQVEGIGGKFFVVPVQAMLDEAVAASGIDLHKVARENVDEILAGDFADLPARERVVLARDRMMQAVKTYINADLGTKPVLPDYVSRHCVNPIFTWSNPADDLTLQNIQARMRLPPPWTVAGMEGKMALVTSNESEAVLGYTTAAGDMHMGGANPIGGVPKDEITASLRYFQQKGLLGLAPIPALFGVMGAPVTAELRKVEQTDEGDLGFSYAQSAFIEHRLIVGRQLPLQVLEAMRASDLFGNDPVALRKIILAFAGRWEAAQFKRIMGTLSPHVGSNVDPHLSVRTTVLGDHFHTSCAHMTLSLLDESLGGGFTARYGLSLAQAKTLAAVNGDFKTALIAWPWEKLHDPANWAGFDRSLLRYAGKAASKSPPSPAPAQPMAPGPNP